MTTESFADNPSSSQYEIRLDGQVAALAEYRLQDDRMTLVHTEVLPGHEGKGLASRLARQVMEDARSRGLGLKLECSFMQNYVNKHPEYSDLLKR
jgi:uncharacterized protein